MDKYLDLTGLSIVWGRMKTYISTILGDINTILEEVNGEMYD